MFKQTEVENEDFNPKDKQTVLLAQYKHIFFNCLMMFAPGLHGSTVSMTWMHPWSHCRNRCSEELSTGKQKRVLV